MDFSFQAERNCFAWRNYCRWGFIEVLLSSSSMRSSLLQTFPALTVLKWRHCNLNQGDGRSSRYMAMSEAVLTVAYVSMMSYLLVKAAQISVLPHAAQDLRCCFHHLGRMSGRNEKCWVLFLQFTSIPKIIGTLFEHQETWTLEA